LVAAYAIFGSKLYDTEEKIREESGWNYRRYIVKSSISTEMPATEKRGQMSFWTLR